MNDSLLTGVIAGVLAVIITEVTRYILWRKDRQRLIDMRIDTDIKHRADDAK